MKFKAAYKMSRITIDKTKPDGDIMCFCKMFTPLFTIMRLALLFPVTWRHKEHCTFKISLIWSIYTLLGISFFTYVVVSSTNYTDMLNNKPTLVYLNDITNAVYGHYVILSLMVSFLKVRKSLRQLRSTANLDPELLCASARVRTCQLQCFAIFFVVFVCGVDFATLTWLSMSKDYVDSDGGVIYRSMQNFPFVVYLIHTSFISCVEASLACLEKTVCNSLGYEKLYPDLDLNENNNKRSLMFVIDYKLCNEEHTDQERFREMSSAEVVQYFRSAHERLCKRIDSTEDIGKPFFLVHTVTELAVLIVRCYAIVTYVIHDLSGAANDAIHVTNCTFVALHTSGLLYFLSTIHHLKSMVETMKIILLEYCTRVTDEETFLQVRLFLEKLEQHRLFTANGVFEVDLKVATSIFTNILTYVLVALQFEISDS